MNANDIIEELSKEYGSLMLLAAYITRETKCTVDEACDKAYALDFSIEQILAEYDDEE
jgi:hypothetical protein